MKKLPWQTRQLPEALPNGAQAGQTTYGAGWRSAIRPFDRRELAQAALVDIRTLSRALDGLRIKDLSRVRIERVFAERNLEHWLPAVASPASAAMARGGGE